MKELLQLLRVYFSDVSGNCQHLVPGKFHRTGLVHGNMPGIRRYNTFILPQQRSDHHRIGLGASGEKKHLTSLTVTGRKNFLLCAFAVRILSIAGQGLQIRFHQPLQQGRMRALYIIIFK